MKVDPNAPVYPHLHNSCQRVSQSEHHPGIPIRLELAARIMAGFATNGWQPGIENGRETDFSSRSYAKAALAWADALVAAHNEENGT